MGLDEELFGESPPEFLHEHFEEDDDPFENSALSDPSIDDFQSTLRKEIESSPIPEGVKPAMDDPVLAGLDKMGKKESRLKKMDSESLAGYGAALLLFIFLLAGMIAMESTILRLWPASVIFYDLVGMKPHIEGEGLILEDLVAQIEDDKILLKGRVINLKSVDMKVPAIMALILDDDGKKIDTVFIPSPIAMMKAEGSVDFNFVYPKRPENATNVTFTFAVQK